MEIEQLRKELNDLLENVVEHSNNYSGNRQIPSLEISYVLTKINKMQETLIVLKHLVKEEERLSKIKKKEQRAEKAQPNPTPIVEEVQQANKTEEVVVEEPVNVVEEEVTAPEAKPITNIEQLPISKLVDAFSLNDRYLFANELFSKDMSAFNEVVKSIDTCSSFEEAKQILMDNGSQHNWDVEGEHVISFTNMVERRFL
jgi:hypothetical protein